MLPGCPTTLPPCLPPGAVSAGDRDRTCLPATWNRTRPRTDFQPRFSNEPKGQCDLHLRPRGLGRHSAREPCGPGRPGARTVEELGALDVALLHLLALVRGRFGVADGGGKDGGAALDQLLAQVGAVAGGGAVQRRPGGARAAAWAPRPRTRPRAQAPRAPRRLPKGVVLLRALRLPRCTGPGVDRETPGKQLSPAGAALPRLTRTLKRPQW